MDRELLEPGERLARWSRFSEDLLIHGRPVRCRFAHGSLLFEARRRFPELSRDQKDRVFQMAPCLGLESLHGFLVGRADAPAPQALVEMKNLRAHRPGRPVRSHCPSSRGRKRGPARGGSFPRKGFPPYRRSPLPRAQSPPWPRRRTRSPRGRAREPIDPRREGWSSAPRGRSSWTRARARARGGR